MESMEVLLGLPSFPKGKGYYSSQEEARRQKTGDWVWYPY